MDPAPPQVRGICDDHHGWFLGPPCARACGGTRRSTADATQPIAGGSSAPAVTKPLSAWTTQCPTAASSPRSPLHGDDLLGTDQRRTVWRLLLDAIRARGDPVPLRATLGRRPAPARAGRTSTPTGPLRRQRRRILPAAGRTHPYMAPAYGVPRLRSDETSEAQAFAQKLHRDRTPGRINAPLRVLEEMAMSVAEARNDGVNPRTASKDAFVWREFQAFAELRGFDPNLQSGHAGFRNGRASRLLASSCSGRSGRYHDPSSTRSRNQ